MKKMVAALTIIALLFSLSFSDLAEAKRGGGGFKSGPQKYKQPAAQDGNIQKTTPAKNTAGTTTAPRNKGFFSGGLMGGLFAGLLLGGLLGSLGVFGNLLGLIMNIALIYILFIAIRGIIRYVVKSRKPSDDRRY
jgi:predicted lipid-binding transport protein (Tim44 family)